FGVWRSYGNHEVTSEELVKMLGGEPVGPWKMTKRDGTGTYDVMAGFDYDENKIVIEYVDKGVPRLRQLRYVRVKTYDFPFPSEAESSQDDSEWAEYGEVAAPGAGRRKGGLGL
ncbi:MAG: hypothetical protein HKL82_02070, partial [Acidimicrobiaceae bacterium]|nr:hypothetical protein [Acidimicrobiaceae bacterium]